MTRLIAFTSLLVLTFIIWRGPIPESHARAFGPKDLNQFNIINNKQKEYKRGADVARKLYRPYQCSSDLNFKTAKSAIDSHLPARLVAAVVIVESSCRSDAVSSTGAIGLMQISKIHHVSRKNLLDPTTNLRIGSKILASNIHRFGLHDGIKFYGPGTDQYAEKVLTLAGIKD